MPSKLLRSSHGIQLEKVSTAFPLHRRDPRRRIAPFRRLAPPMRPNTRPILRPRSQPADDVFRSSRSRRRAHDRLRHLVDELLRRSLDSILGHARILAVAVPFFNLDGRPRAPAKPSWRHDKPVSAPDKGARTLAMGPFGDAKASRALAKGLWQVAKRVWQGAKGMWQVPMPARRMCGSNCGAVEALIPPNRIKGACCQSTSSPHQPISSSTLPNLRYPPLRKSDREVTPLCQRQHSNS